MNSRKDEHGAALMVVIFILVFVITAGTYLLTRSAENLRISHMFRKMKTSSSLANNVVTDLMRQFSQTYQEDHYDTTQLSRNPAFYSQGFSSVAITANRDQHFIAFSAIGSYGKDLNNPQHKRTIEGVIKFISDLTTFGTMWNGNFTTSASNATYTGKMWVNGSWTISGNNARVEGGPVFVNGNISTTGGGSLVINGDLYRSGTRTGTITVNGTDNTYVPQMTWPTIDRTYFDTYSNVKLTANTNLRFNYDTGSATGTVRIGTITYIIPTTGFIIYGRNCTLTSSGTVRGRVAIASIRTSGGVGGNIIIDNHMKYATVGSTNFANPQDSFAAVASNSIQFNRASGTDLYVSGVYFVDSTGTTGMSSSGSGILRIFGTRNKGITLSGFSGAQITYDTNMDTYPPPGLPEKPNLVTWHFK